MATFQDKSVAEVLALVAEYWNAGSTLTPTKYFDSRFTGDEDTKTTFCNICEAGLIYEANDGREIKKHYRA